MKIVDVTCRPFVYKTRMARDSEGHSHPVPERDAIQTMLTVTTDEGISISLRPMP